MHACWCSVFIGGPYKMKKFNSSSFCFFFFASAVFRWARAVKCVLKWYLSMLFCLHFRSGWVFEDVTCFVISLWISSAIDKMRAWVMRRFYNKSNETPKSKIPETNKTCKFTFLLFGIIMLFRIPNMASNRDRLFIFHVLFILIIILRSQKKLFEFSFARIWRRDFEKSLIRHQRIWCGMEEPIL